MRLTRLRIDNYGCFARAELAFAAEPGRINLVVAPNGAGKSLLRQAFHDLLFDIPAQTPMKFRFGYTGMALHADALAADGVAFSFGWARQGKPPRSTSDPTRYAALREQTTPRQLEQLFALDTIRLRQGGLDLKGGETLAEALLSGTGELARPRRVLAEIEARRAANWGQNKSKPPLNAALAALNDARKRMRAAVERPEHRERAQRELESQRALVAAARAARQTAAETRQRLYRIELTRPLLRQLQEARGWLDANPDSPALPASLEQDLADARAEMSRAEATLSADEAGAKAASEALAAIVPDDAATRHRELLATLPEQLGRADEARDDIVTIEATLAAAEAGIRAALHELGANVPVESAPSLIPTVGLVAEARAAIQRHAVLSSACTLQADHLRTAKRRTAELAQPPDQAEQVPPELTMLLAEIRADRDPMAHAAELAKAERRAAVELQAALALVPGWSARADALRMLAVPPAATLQRLDAALAACVRACGESLALRADREAERQRCVGALAALHETPLPDEASVIAARAERDRGWRLIHQRAFADATPDLAEERAFAGAEPLPLAFERRLRSADSLADQRLAELTRINQVAGLQRDLMELDAGCAAAAEQTGRAQANLDSARAAWAAAVAPLGFAQDAAMGEAAAFLDRRAAAIEAMKAFELASGEAAALRQIHQAWVERLAVLLSANAVDLAALLASADAAVRRAGAAQETWLRWQADHRAAQRELEQADDRAAAAERDVRVWWQAWEAILSRLGRAGGEMPEATAAVLDCIAVLDKHHRAADELRSRIHGMRARLDRFAASVRDLTQSLGTPRERDDFATARALILRRDEAAQAASAWAIAQERVTQTGRVLQEARERHGKAAIQCSAVIAACGASTLDEAESRIVASRAHLRFAELRDTALGALAEHGGGLTIEALLRQADAVPPEAMQAEAERAHEAAEEANRREVAAAVALQSAEEAFATGAEETRALDAASQYAASSAQYARLLEEQLVLHLAHDMLHAALDAVQAEAGEDGIGRLSSIVSDVTGGAYTVALSEEDGTTLHAIEASFPAEPKKLDQLSEGTRDQLYLALRILALREHAAGATPLPFIADDILQTFDDARAEAALHALVALSQDVQVIVLTHHAHLAALAGRLGAAVHVQALN